MTEMHCGFNIVCRVQAEIAPYLWWLMVAGGLVAAVLVVAALYWAYRIGRWPALVAGLLIVSFGLGYGARVYQDVTAPPAIERPYLLTEADGQAVQQKLQALKFYKGPIDGILGAQSRTAIKLVQRRIGETETGTLTPGVLAALGIKFGSQGRV